MFEDVPALHAALLQKRPRDFVSHFIFEPVPFAFSNDLPAWIGWKTTLAERLEVDPHDIVVTGSGAVGYSLNPNKNFKAFDHSSDLDCGVISPYHFEQAMALPAADQAVLAFSAGPEQKSYQDAP